MTRCHIILLLVACAWAFNVSEPTPFLQMESSAKLSDLVGKSSSGETILEGSGVVYRPDLGQAFVVCDNLPSEVIQLDQHSSPNDAYRGLHWTLDYESYEGITFDNMTKTYYLVSEQVNVLGETRYKARVLSFNENFLLLSANFIDYVFDTDNKGIEGLSYIYRDGVQYLLALCEGNSCQGGDEGKTPGSGTILVVRFDNRIGDREGTWKVEANMTLPKNLPFEDYAGIDVHSGRYITVVSQTSSLLWIGRISPDSWTIEGGDNGGSLFAFPLNSDEEIKFCNVEGVSWIDPTTVIIASDKSDSDECDRYAESATIFKIPFRD